MRLGLRALLLLVALILFIVAALSDGDSAFNFLCIGLACFAGAFLADDLPVGGGFGNIGGSGGRRDN